MPSQKDKPTRVREIAPNSGNPEKDRMNQNAEDGPDSSPHHLKHSRMMNPGMLKVFAYTGQAWKMEMVSGVVVATAGVILVIFGLVQYTIFKHTQTSFIIAGSVVFILGFLFMFRAFYWWLNNRKTEEDSAQSIDSQLLPSQENGDAALPQNDPALANAWPLHQDTSGL